MGDTEAGICPEYGVVIERQLMNISPIKEAKEVSKLLQLLDTARIRYQRIVGAGVSHDKLHTALMRTVPNEFSNHCVLNSVPIKSYVELRKVRGLESKV